MGRERVIPRTIPIGLFVLAVCLAGAVAARAQGETQPPVHHHADTTTSDQEFGTAGSDPEFGSDPDTWSWSTDANVIFGYNYQQRKFADFWAWESQNWMMLSGERVVGGGRLTLSSMFSLEPFTMAGIGSPQLYQTGESY